MTGSGDALSKYNVSRKSAFSKQEQKLPEKDDMDRRRGNEKALTTRRTCLRLVRLTVAAMAWLFGSSKSSRSAASARRGVERDEPELQLRRHTSVGLERSKSLPAEMPHPSRQQHGSKSERNPLGKLAKSRWCGKSTKQRHVFEEHAECSVCFEALCDAPSAVFVLTTTARDGKSTSRKRSCAHFFHLRCARCLQSKKFTACPVCRAHFDDVLPVPDPATDPERWFEAVDANGDGRLSPNEVLEVLRAQIPCDWRAIERHLTRRSSGDAKKSLFDRWDPDGDGFIEKKELIAPGGLLEYVIRKFPKRNVDDDESSDGVCSFANATNAAASTSHLNHESWTSFSSREDPPELAKFPSEWFAFWDTNASGSLDKEEVTRALVKTSRHEREFSERGELLHRQKPRSSTTYGRDSYTRLLTDVAAARQIRNVIDAVWPVIVSGGNAGAVDKREFLKPDGLAEAIVANVRYWK